MSDPRPYRLLWLTCGHLVFGLGAVGIFVPLLPTTPLWILAVVCYSRSSEKFESYIVNHPKYGAAVQAFRSRGVVGRQAKVLATIVICMSASIPTLFIAVPLWAVLLMWVCLLAVLGFVWSRPES